MGSPGDDLARGQVALGEQRAGKQKQGEGLENGACLKLTVEIGQKKRKEKEGRRALKCKTKKEMPLARQFLKKKAGAKASEGSYKQ